MSKSTSKNDKSGSKNAPVGKCEDGCGATANPGRRFLPGHDAKLASLLQRAADGEMAKATLPKLVRDNLSSGRENLPAPRFQSVDMVVVVKVRVPAGEAQPITAAATVLHTRLNVRTVAIVAIGPPAKEAKEKAAAKEKATAQAS